MTPPMPSLLPLAVNEPGNGGWGLFAGGVPFLLRTLFLILWSHLPPPWAGFVELTLEGKTGGSATPQPYASAVKVHRRGMF